MKPFKFYHKTTWEILTITAPDLKTAKQQLPNPKEYNQLQNKKPVRPYYNMTMGDFEYKFNK